MLSMGHSECPHGAHPGTSSALKQRPHTCVRGRRVHEHMCASVCTASRYHPAATHHLRRIEQRASNVPPRGLNTAPTVRRAKPHTCVAHEVLTGVRYLPAHCCVARAICALSASPSSASSWHGSCRRAARQMLMRTAAYDKCVLHDTWHMCIRLHGTCHAARRTQLARPAYAAFSTVSSAICARSSAMPAGSLSNVLCVSTASPTGEIVP